MCCVMPPLSPLTTSMPMMRSKSDVLPWSTWPRKVITGGSRLELRRIVGLVAQAGENLLRLIDFVLEVDFDAQLDGQ